MSGFAYRSICILTLSKKQRQGKIRLFYAYMCLAFSSWIKRIENIE